MALSKMRCYLLLWTIIYTQVIIWSHGRHNALNTFNYNQFELSLMRPTWKPICLITFSQDNEKPANKLTKKIPSTSLEKEKIQPYCWSFLRIYVRREKVLEATMRLMEQTEQAKQPKQNQTFASIMSFSPFDFQY